MEIAKTILLVRHGTTAQNENDLWQGRSDHPLSEKGFKEAELLAVHFKDDVFDMVYHSPMKRALQTAQIINKNHGKPLSHINDFVEIDVGDYDGLKHADILKKYPDVYRDWIMDSDLAIPGGESFQQVYDRVKTGVDEILSSPYKHILIVGHAMVNRAILGQMLKMGPFAARRFRMTNCGYSKFLVYHTPHGNHIVVDSWNNTAHLAKN